MEAVAASFFFFFFGFDQPTNDGVSIGRFLGLYVPSSLDNH